jgi:aminopeptidase N
MKNVAILAFILVSGLLQAQVMFDAGDLSGIASAERDANAGKLSSTTRERSSNYDVKWYRCSWNIDPRIKKISGSVTTLFSPSQPGLNSLVFDMNNALQTDSVIFHGLPVSWQHASNLLTIHFPTSDPPYNMDSVSVYYHGVPPDNGFGSFVQSTHNGAPVIWTLSEPYGSSDWWPCKNGLTDKADSIDIFIRTPSAYKSASNGILVSASPLGQDIVYHWKHRYPVAAYLVCLAVTNYVHYQHLVPFGADSLDVDNYVYPEDLASATVQTASIVPMIQLYDTLFGIYPFQNEKYGHAQFGWGGGMEHQTMTFVASFGFELLAHELAHQWFGDKITCGSWADIWLNEGFATYLSGLCYEHLAPAWWKRFRQVRVASIVSKPGGSVYCTDTTDINRIFDGRLSYAKGAMILHQLRWIIGDSAFYAALNNYLSDTGLAYGFARTSQLKSHLERSCGQDLTWYFNDWYTGEGYPSYHINWTQKSDSVNFTISQTQSHPSVPFFEMPVPLMFKNPSRDTIIRFSNTFSGQPFTVILPFKVDSVLFDPDCQLISGSNTIGSVAENTRQRNLRVYPNPAANLVTFSFGESPSRENVRILIYDPSGHLKDEIRFSRGKTKVTLNTTNYLPGLYFYVLPGHDIPVSGKFMIIR